MSIRVLSSINNIEASAWDALWSDYPFTRHAFLAALETTGCTTKKSGWQVQHLVYEENQQIVAAMPLYLKYDSWGEYVFDWSWADAYQRNGFDYYPKLLSAIPFTPATGPRFGFAPTLAAENKINIVKAFTDFCLHGDFAGQASGFHLLFPDAIDAEQLKQCNLLERYGYQFHWFNRNYNSFEDFLSSFASRKRKNLKREREKVAQAELKICVEQGEEISAERWQTFFIFYHTTYLKRSGRYGYLNHEFFQQLGTALKNQVVLISALKAGKPLAMALYFRDEKNLYGRYWGCEQEIDFLHFELCYYQGIEYAIKHKLQRFDPGAQGEHKIQRGFTPIYTRSFHHLANPMFAQAIVRFLKEEKQHLRFYMQEAREALPFKDGTELIGENILLEE